MKRLIVLLLVVVFFISGCAYMKQTLLEIRGDEVNVPLGIGQGIKGKGLKAFLYRQVSIAFPAKESLKEFKNIKTTDGTTAEGSTGSIDITK